MHVPARFVFDHEASDDARTTAAIETFRTMGLQMGADVTVYYCPVCDVAEALFDYSRVERRSSA